MQCLKCGRKIQDGQVFCEGCLEVMQNYPVKPGTVVLLPSHREKQEEKKKTGKNRPLTPVEQNVLLRAAIRRLRKVAAILFLLVCTVSAALVYVLMKKTELLNFVR